MATNLTRRGARANNPALLPALPDEQGIADAALRMRFQLIREWLEVRLGARGDFYERAVTHRELEAQLAQVMADAGVSDEDKRLLGLLNQLGSQLQGLVRQVSLVQSILNQTIDNSNTAITNIYNQVRDVAVEDVVVFARDMLPSVTGGCSALTTIEFSSTKPNFHALLFDKTTDESADFHTMLPFSWAGRMFRVYVYWGHGAGGTTFGTTWEVTANSTSDNESVILDFVGGAVITDTGGTSGNLYIAAYSDPIPIASNINRNGDLVSLRIYRRPTHASDNLDIDAALLAVRFTLSDVPFPVTTETASTWDTANETGTWTFSNGDKTASHVSGTGVVNVHGAVGRSTGKRYFEVVADDVFTVFHTGVRHDIGLTEFTPPGTGGSDVDGSTGSGQNAACYRVGGVIRVNGSSAGSVTALANGDVVGVAVDLDTGKVWFSRNGTWTQGDPATDTSPEGTLATGSTYFPGIAVESGAHLDATLRTTLAEFDTPPPTGFVSWATA